MTTQQSQSCATDPKQVTQSSSTHVTQTEQVIVGSSGVARARVQGYASVHLVVGGELVCITHQVSCFCNTAVF
jgi:rRNA processing protein Krr1/Pno1